MKRGAEKQTILLLQPRIGYMDSLRSAPSLPLGLLHAASIAVEKFRVVIFDQRTASDWRSELGRVVIETEPLLIGATMFLGPTIVNALDMLAVARSASDAPTVIGGVLPSLVPKLCLADPNVDMVVQGEGERTLARLAEKLSRGESPAGIPGVWTKKSGGVPATADALLELDTLPEIPYRLLPVERYMPSYGGAGSFYMETSRGCPMNCAYCFNTEFNHGKWRSQSSRRVEERLELANEKFGAKNIYFVDDNFFIDLRRGLEIARTLQRLGMEWQIQGVGISSLRKMLDEDFALLRDCGLKRITIGVESGSAEVRRTLGKSYTNDDVREVVTRLKRFDFIVFCSFMCGIPSETREDVRKSVDLALELLTLNPNFRVSPFYSFTPTPGTKLFDAAVERGFVPPATLREWGGISFDGGSPVGDTEAAFRKGLYVATLFCDDKPREYSASLLFRIAAFLYRPIARRRLRSMFFGFMPEINILNRMLKRKAGG